MQYHDMLLKHPSTAAWRALRDSFFVDEENTQVAWHGRRLERLKEVAFVLMLRCEDQTVEHTAKRHIAMQLPELAKEGVLKFATTVRGAVFAFVG